MKINSIVFKNGTSIELGEDKDDANAGRGLSTRFYEKMNCTDFVNEIDMDKLSNLSSTTLSKNDENKPFTKDI